MVVVLGETSPAVWSDELRRTGRVVFTLRPRAVRNGLCQMWLGLVVLQVVHWATPWSQGAGRIIAVVLELSAVLAVTGWYGWRLATRYPMLTVSYDGVQVGRAKYLLWADVGTIGLVRGRRQFILPIVKKDLSGKDLTVSRMAVSDLRALATWLEDLLRQQRNSERR